MAEKHSLKEILFKLYEDELFDALAEYLENDPSAAQLKNDDDIESIEPYSIRIKFVRVEDLPKSSIKLDVVIEAELLVSTEYSRDSQDDDLESQWFNVNCTVDIGNQLTNFVINDIEVYRRQRKNENPLSDSLVPILWKKELDLVAEEFLRQYYPEALTAPQAIDIEKLTSRLGVTVKAANLSEDCSIFGAMVFADTTVKGVVEGVYKEELVSAGTLYYDPNVFFLRTLGSVRNTIVHECVHWVYHRKAMALERMFNPEITDIRCQVEEVSENTLKSNKRNPLDWMEWHANALAPRILMPKSMFKSKADSVIHSLKIQYQTSETSSVMEQAIQEIAEFFGVSKLSTKLRFIDLGYEEARGTYNYQSNGYIPSYSFREGSINKFQSFDISALDFMSIYAVDKIQNGHLNRLFDQGVLKYVEFSICLNDPKYIEENEHGALSLTPYARQHMDECCLKFNLTYKKTATFGQTSSIYLFKKWIEALIPKISYEATENGELLEKADVLSRQSQQVKFMSQLLMELPGSFSKSLKQIMKVYGVTNEELAKTSTLDVRTIQRYRNDPPPYNKDTVIDICVGLKLPLPLAKDLLYKADCPLGFSERDMVIEMLIGNGNYTDIFDFHSQCSNIVDEIP